MGMRAIVSWWQLWLLVREHASWSEAAVTMKLMWSEVDGCVDDCALVLVRGPLLISLEVTPGGELLGLQ